VRKKRQKVGYIPSACLVCVSLIRHDIRRIYGKRTLCNLLREGCTRAYCEIRRGYFAVTGDTKPIRVVCNQWCATAMHRYTKTHEYVGTRRRHVSNVGQPSGTTRGGTVLDGKLNFVYHGWGKYPREGIVEPLCVTLWTRTLVSMTGDRVTSADKVTCTKFEKNANLDKEICNKI